MRRFIFCLIVLVVAVWLGVKIAADPGYVLIAYHNWTAETPVWFALMTLVITFMLIYLLVRLLKNLGRLPRKIRNWTARRRARINQRLTHQGLLALSFGKWVEAEKKLIKATPANAIAWVNYLAAARAAYERGDKDKREYYLQQAIKVSKDAEIAVGIEQFQFQYEQQQFEQALAILQRLHQLAPKQNYILRLLIQLCARIEDWQTVLTLLAQARKQKALSEEKLEILEVQAQTALLTKFAKQEADLAAIKAYWDNIPRLLRKHPTLLHGYATALISKGEQIEAEKLLRIALNKEWNTELVYAYGLLEAKPDEQLTYAEKWLPAHENDAILLLTLGRICLRNQLWGKARSYLESSIAMQPRAETYFELAKLFEKIADHEHACVTYKEGLALATGLPLAKPAKIAQL